MCKNVNEERYGQFRMLSPLKFPVANVQNLFYNYSSWISLVLILIADADVML